MYVSGTYHPERCEVRSPGIYLTVVSEHKTGHLVFALVSVWQVRERHPVKKQAKTKLGKR